MSKAKRVVLHLNERQANWLLQIFREYGRGGLPPALNDVRTKLYNQMWWIKGSHEEVCLELADEES